MLKKIFLMPDEHQRGGTKTEDGPRALPPNPLGFYFYPGVTAVAVKDILINATWLACETHGELV
jgi:hypothetical protein